MLLILLAILMRYVDISKVQQSQRCATCGSVGADCGCEDCNDANGNAPCWRHVAATSNSSSTSSGCDSNSSSKENYYLPQQQQQQQQQQQRAVLPGGKCEQLEQLRYYQRMQQQQLKLLQQQLLQRRFLQQQLLQQGVSLPPKQNRTRPTASTASMTCNQQYLLQQRQQNSPHAAQFNYDNNKNIDNYQHHNNAGDYGKGLHFRRGMTELSTNNDDNININSHNIKSHLISQPLQSSPVHQPYAKAHPTSLYQYNHFYYQQPQKQPPAFNANSTTSSNNGNKNANNTTAHIALTTESSASASASASASSSPYRNPLNSPSNSPFITATATTGKRFQQLLNDRLQCQQQQLQLLAEGCDLSAADELSDESLKQNVAIVLSNLDRYNNALRSVILNEQIISGSNSLLLCDESLPYDFYNVLEDVEKQHGGFVNSNSSNNNNNNNNNFLLNYRPTMAATNVAAAATPESDYNSNATTPGARNNEMLPPQHGVGAMFCVGDGVGHLNGTNSIGGNNVNCSLASSHDFTHDNSDYQWFLDYGYRDGCSGMQRSVLSSLSSSYNAMGDLIYYEDLAKNLDANLAEVDMESFRAEDIHSLLSQLPAYCKSLGGTNSRLQQSLLLQQQLQHSNMLPNLLQTAHNMSETSTTSTNELIDNSFCKSELLFSPVKESNISVSDSLDMDAYPDDGDIILTCKANKDNYTIAFEGSVLYSDESFYAEPSETAIRNKQNCINLHNNLEDIVKRNKALEASMSRSAQTFQPLCLYSHKAEPQLQRYPSGNNNTGTETITITRHLPQCSVRKSSSLPNLHESRDALNSSLQQESSAQQHQQQLNVSQAISTSTMESCTTRNLLPMCQMPISISVSVSERLQQHQAVEGQQQQVTPTNQYRHKHRCSCTSSTANDSQNFCSAAHAQKHAHISGSASSGSSNPPAFNLVKLFIKQKSNNCAAEEAQTSTHTCMDVSSGCWPSSDAAGSSSSSSLEQRLRKKSMNDSGKGSAVSRHEDEQDQCQQCNVMLPSTPKRLQRTREALFYDDGASSSSAGSMTATNSPAHRRRNTPLHNPQLYQIAANTQTQTSQQLSEASNSSEQLTLLSVAGKRHKDNGRPLSNACSSEMITRSMQTSCGSLSTTRSSLSDRFRCVPPSFLAKLNNLGEERQAPIYVIYPNYALPDLGFVKTNVSSTEVIFSPFNYKMTMDGATVTSTASLKKRQSLSADEDELFKTLDYNHIADWQSLAILLPSKYRRRLKIIPEVQQMVSQLEVELSQRPLFCMSPPIRRNRPNICDCAKYMQQMQMEEETSSGSSQQPSSGYRGSSTLLTDSELDPLYIYQYEQQRMDSGAEARQTPPQPMPRSILRKTPSTQPRSKRNSMIEAQQTQKLAKLEKRRSLQEPPYNFTLASTDELAEVFEEEDAAPQPVTNLRLSRRDLDARARAENFLASLPRSELKYYAEIAAILESSGELVQYDAAALKKEVSRVLSQQKKVSFNDDASVALPLQAKRFTTPPNSPNISIAALQRRETLDAKEQRKIESNRFKRLQIQWELMSKDSSMLKELVSEQATKSGGSTPTSTATGANSAHKSRIPRPVSYPAGRTTPTKPASTPTKMAAHASPQSVTKTRNTHAIVSSPQTNRVSTQDAGSSKCNTRSPSRIVPPKRYSIATTPTPTTPTGPARARTPNGRMAVTAPNTPKRQSVAQSPRPISRVR
ncbi:uncharacterized protein LOC115620956 isoform X2 [Scaptodrosophila lebanonensis]|uniref:Uncharacterized protein LOC115620956 isoform X2 n=1 Tax=Drosophila lebanonensis TaxID=7225 RepID=A0A6J2T5D8_DROLE|nr:uncharacterized protein LOC115620956 isoform X2 [Scaptodrosophila lebanonensis]